MSDRERIRRPEPARTEPVRNLSGVFRGDAPAAPGASPDAPAGAGRAAAANPFAWPDDDPVSRAVRAGCDVVEQAVRRGFGLGGAPSPGAPWMPVAGPGPWTTGQWVDTMAGAFTMWAQWVDAWSTTARSMTSGGRPGGAEPGPGTWSPAPPGPAPSSAAAGPLHLTVELRTARAASVELDLSPGVSAALEVHGLLAPAAAAAPPITDVSVAIVDGGVKVGLGSIEHHPAGTYAGAVLAAGRACGTLTVRLT